MALSCLLRGTSIKFRVSSLQSLMRSPVLPCSSVVTGSQFHHTPFSQSPLFTQKSKQNVPSTALNLQTPLLQSVKQFSLSSKNMASHGHDHSKLWTAERALAVSLAGLVPAAFLFPNPILEYILSTLIVMHNHWGFEAVVVDYVRPSVVGEIIPKIALGSLYVVSVATLAGLFFFITNDVGIVNAIKMFWKL